ncbi:MAG: DUF4270 family protein [Chryseolinea sp.]
MRLPVGYFLAFVIFLMAGCANEPGTLGIERGGLASDFGVVVVDTTTVAVATVLLDSVPTSDLGSLLIGGYKDDKLGRLSAEAFSQIGNGGSWTPPTLATFDSIILIAHFSKYFYGDTTVSQTLEVKRILEPFRIYSLPQFWINEGQYSVLYAAGAKYNSSLIRTDPTPLGSRTFQFRPHSTDTIVVRLPDQLGMDWLALAKENSPKIQNADNFIEYFKGISIATVSPDPAAVVGLNTAKLRVRIYFKSYVNEKLVQQFRDFPFGSGLYNYSRLTSDRSGTVLDPLKKRQEGVSSIITGNEAFVQSGIGIATKLTFPYITNLLRQSDALLINQAQLILEPIKESYNDTYPLPRSLTIFSTDKTNLPLARLGANYSSTSSQTAYISFDKEYDTSTGYVFTLTQYFNELLAHNFSKDNGLLIMPPPDEMSKTVNKIQFGGGSGNYRVKLKIWYTYKK